MDLSIIIVNWKSKDYLKKCIASVYAANLPIDYEIIVIDGGSFDGCGEILREYYPGVHFIQSKKNIGFAKANNQAFKISKGSNILFLNPDTEVDKMAIMRLINQLESLKDAGIVGAKLINSEGKVQMSSIQSFPNILNQILDIEILRCLFKGWSLWGTLPLYRKDLCDPNETDAVSGACLMIRRSIFEDVGMFSGDYFMYSEDIDLCLKTRQKGWKTYFVPSAVVVHHGGASSSKNTISTFSAVMMLESRLRYFHKNKSLWYGQQFRFYMFAVSALRIFSLVFIWPVFRIIGKSTRVEIALVKWWARLRWTIGLEGWVKYY